jgi:hypothetical protein
VSYDRIRSDRAHQGDELSFVCKFSLHLLLHTVITDPDSKFKGQFKEAFLVLKIHHHLSARGHHDAILVERFNPFLSAGLHVFNNDRETNRVFVEGAQTLTYACNSCPVHGTDLSRSLLTVGREFHFPIDFEANRQRSYNVTDNDKKVFADNLTNLLIKSSSPSGILKQSNQQPDGIQTRQYRFHKRTSPEQEILRNSPETSLHQTRAIQDL